MFYKQTYAICHSPLPESFPYRLHTSQCDFGVLVIQTFQQLFLHSVCLLNLNVHQANLSAKFFGSDLGLVKDFADHPRHHLTSSPKSNGQTLHSVPLQNPNPFQMTHQNFPKTFQWSVISMCLHRLKHRGASDNWKNFWCHVSIQVETALCCRGFIKPTEQNKNMTSTPSTNLVDFMTLQPFCSLFHDFRWIS